MRHVDIMAIIVFRDHESLINGTTYIISFLLTTMHNDGTHFEYSKEDLYL